MATSKVSIANGALQRLGAARITSFDQDHKNARAMKAAYDGERDSLLRRYTWGFAVKRASIAADGAETVWGGHNRFSLPNDYLRLIRDDETSSFLDWKIEGLFVVTDDAAPLEIRYVARIDDPNYYDSLFIEALECALALKTCKEITGSESDKASLKADFDDAIAEAKRWGAIEKGAQDFPEDEWLSARR